MARTITASPNPLPLIAGHFVEGANYNTWRPQGTRDYLLLLTITGQGRIGWANGETRINAGEVCLLRPGASHDYGTAPGADRWELLWTHFLPRPHWFALLDWPEIAPEVCRLTLGVNTAEVHAALADMNRRTKAVCPAATIGRCTL